MGACTCDHKKPRRTTEPLPPLDMTCCENRRVWHDLHVKTKLMQAATVCDARWTKWFARKKYLWNQIVTVHNSELLLPNDSELQLKRQLLALELYNASMFFDFMILEYVLMCKRNLYFQKIEFNDCLVFSDFVNSFASPLFKKILPHYLLKWIFYANVWKTVWALHS